MKKILSFILAFMMIATMAVSVSAAEMTEDEILEAAFALESGDQLDGTHSLTGVVTSIDTAYSTQYKNITVTIQVKDKYLQCYRLKGGEDLGVGDTITVTGTIKNYNGNVQFNAGATYVLVSKGEEVKAPTDPKEILKQAFKLDDGAALPYEVTLTGVVESIDTAYSTQYKNITVTIKVENKSLQCYRLKGGEDLGVGDTITVTGTIKKYNEKVQFNTGATYVLVSKAEAEVEAPSDPKQIVDEAYALEKDESLPYEATLTGKIVKIDTPYSSQYKNITVSIAVEGREDKPIVCFRLKGEGADTLAVGDIIKVTGKIKNYKDTIEFDAGCTFVMVKKSEAEIPTCPEDPKEVVDAAYALEEGASLPYEATLTGKIVSIDTPYSADYKNVTVTIAIEGKEDKPIICFRLKGEGADTIKVGDEITVTGSLINYGGKIEFNSGCKLVSAPTHAPQTGVATVILTVVAVLSGAYIVTKKH